MLRPRPALATFIIALATATPAMAQPVATGSEDRTRVEGDYGGVTPGEAATTPPRARGTGRYTPITWLGFQVRDDGSSLVFLQLTGPVEVEQEVVGDRLYVNYVGARFASRNTRRFLDVRFFDTALARIESRSVPTRRARGDRPATRAGAMSVLTFKNPADARQAKVTKTPEKDGYVYIYLELGPPSQAGTSE
jgi:hypothetical protein